MSELPDVLKNLEPHRLSEKGMARMAVRYAVDPTTGRLTGERYVDPIVIACLAHHGYDPEPYVKHLLEMVAEDDVS
jgi:hypothetical protein